MRTISKATKSERGEKACVPLAKVRGNTACYPLGTRNTLQEVSRYQWHSKQNRTEAAQNLACAYLAWERNMPAQTEARLTKAQERYDTDRVERAICHARTCYPTTKLFTVTKSLRDPILVQGKNHIWAGLLLSEQFTLQREDHLIPKEVMNRLHLLRLKGLHFEDGFALFSPYMPYEPPMKMLLAEQYGMLKRDTALLLRAARSVVSTGTKMAGSFVSSIPTKLSPVNRILDPVLTGVIAGSLRDRRYFFIELGRWIHSD